MPQEPPTDPAAWVRAATCALRKHGSWTGRTHIQKALFVTQILTSSRPPFEFEMYDYGPYSFALDREIGDLELLGELVTEYPRPGYSPRYRAPEDDPESTPLSECDHEAVERVAEALGTRKSKQLELLATCLWVEQREEVHGDDAIVQRVQQLKPKYGESEVREALTNARSVSQILQGAANGTEA